MSSGPRPNQMPDVSPEEVTFVKDCMNGKTYTHVLPMAIGSIAAMKIASMKGYHLGILARFGVVFSSMALGRLASIPSCLEAAEVKFPEGTLAAKKRSNRDTLTFAPESQEQMPVMDYYNSSKVTQSSPQQSSQFTPSAPSAQQTYDDLRRMNRDQYTSRRTAPSTATAPRDYAAGSYPPQQPNRPDEAPFDPHYSHSSFSDHPTPYSEHTPTLSSIQADDDVPSKVKRRRVNVYGDEIED